MRRSVKLIVLFSMSLLILILLAVNLANAQEQPITDVEAVVVAEDTETAAATPDRASLEPILAPIALYPDVLLSHILVASTYPLELLKAARWRKQRESLSENEALQAAENKDWDPSIKALAPYTDLLQTLTDDLDWLQQLGDAFLHHEEAVLASVQHLRDKARQAGHLADNAYIEVVEDEQDIIIQPVEREVIYVPYYDTRVVFGNVWWHDIPPYRWRHPSHYAWHAGFYWSPGFYFGHRYFFAGVHWRNRYTVVHHYHNNFRHRYTGHRRIVRSREYQRWQHNRTHRRTVPYREAVSRSVSRQQIQRQVDVMETGQRRRQVSAVTPANRQPRRVDAAHTHQRLRQSSQRHETRQADRRTVRAHSERKNGRSDKRRYVEQPQRLEARRTERQDMNRNTRQVRNQTSSHSERRSVARTEQRTVRRNQAQGRDLAGGNQQVNRRHVGTDSSRQAPRRTQSRQQAPKRSRDNTTGRYKER